MRRAGAVSVSRTTLLVLICIASIFLLPNPVGAQTTSTITETGTGTQTQTSPQGCQNGGECTSELVGSITGTPITNPDDEGEDAGINATLTADYSQATSPTPDTFSAPTTGTATLTDANGSTLELDVEGDYTGNNDGTGPTTFTGTFTVTGGTGNFADATGSGDITATSENGEFTAELDGTLTLPDPTDPVPTAPACPAGTDQVVTFSSDATLEPFRIDEENFQVRYAVEAEQATATGDESFEISVRQGGAAVGSAEETEFPVTDGVLEVDDAGPGSFRLIVVDQDVVFAITVCEGGGGGAGGDGADDEPYDDGNGDVDDPDDVVPGTGADGDLPDTGGAPLLFGAAALVLAAALLARRVLAP
jgi:hypothetical protein